MWSGGGRFYWRRREDDGGATAGIAVLFAWLSSRDQHLNPFVDLYASLGWSSLVCHSDFLTLFFPEKATKLARGVLQELFKEVKIKPLPIIFVAFSGGLKGYMYKVLQLMEGSYEGQLSLDEYKLVRECVCGQIYDSSPVDVTSDLGTRFILHPHPPRVVSWMSKAIVSGLDTLFQNRFEAQRAEYWQTLYSTVSVGPFLIFCSEDDELAPYPVIYNFSQNLQELGGDVRIMKWNNSPHVGHYKHHRTDYTVALTELLSKATIIYSHRQQDKMGTNSCQISKSVWDLHKAAVCSNESFRRVAVRPSDHFFLPSSMEYEGTRDVVSMQGENKGDLIHLQSQPAINPHGVLSQILFDACVPRNVEGWDLKPASSSRQKHGPSNPIRCIRRSRL